MSNGDGAVTVGASLGPNDCREAGAPGAPPSLFSGKTGATTVSGRQPEKISILSTLDEGGRVKRSVGTKVEGLLLVVLGLCLLAMVLAIGLLAFDGNDPREQVTQPIVPVSESRPLEALPQRPMGGAATIETVALPTATASSADAAVGRTENVALASLPEQASGSTSHPFSALDPASEIPVTTFEAQRKGSSATSAPVAKASGRRGDANRSRPHTDRVRAGKRKTVASHDDANNSQPQTDRDAELLAALVAHEEGTSVRSGKKKQTPIAEKEAAPKSASSATRGRASRFDPKRDVVMDDKDLTTAELVRRCGSLGLVEGFLCKQRVCSPQTGSDPACHQGVPPSISGGEPLSGPAQ